MRKEIINYFEKRGHKNIKIKRMPEAWSNLHTYKVSSDKEIYILKMFTDYIQNEKKVALREYKLLKLFKNITPKVFSIDSTSFGHPAILMEFIKGKSMDKWKLSNKDIDDIVKLLAKIHLTKITPKVKNIFKTTQPKMPQDWRGAKAWAKKVKDKDISKRLVKLLNKVSRAKRFAHTPTICHGDFKHLNILKSKQGLKLVDWESAHIGDPAKDFAQFFYLADYWKQGPSKQQRKMMISKYKKLRKEKDNFENRINYWCSKADITEILWRVRHRLYVTGKKLDKLNKSLNKLEKKWLN